MAVKQLQSTLLFLHCHYVDLFMRGHMDKALKETLTSLESYREVYEITHWTAGGIHMAERTEGDIKLPIHSVSLTALKVWNISILERVSQYHYFRITLVHNFLVLSTTEIWERRDLS